MIHWLMFKSCEILANIDDVETGPKLYRKTKVSSAFLYEVLTYFQKNNFIEIEVVGRTNVITLTEKGKKGRELMRKLYELTGEANERPKEN